MLHLKTITPTLQKIIQTVATTPELSLFRLVGGTALSLYLGHRVSVDADFFSENAFDKREIEQIILRVFPDCEKVSETAYGFTWVYEDVKIDFYDWKVRFLNPATLTENMKLASLPDIAAYKLDAVVGRKTEKDYRDVAQLLEVFTLSEMIKFYQQKFPYNNARIVLDHLTVVAQIERDASIIEIIERDWTNVVEKINEATNLYFEQVIEERNTKLKLDEDRLTEILSRRNTK